MQFRDSDHLKNGEGLASHGDGDGDGDNSLHARIRRTVSERTDGRCSPPPSAKVLLLTHLRYFGYCFNPVSFYYVLAERKNSAAGDGASDDDGEDGEIVAVVAEVSNTPWGEMRCYVLHPDSADVTRVKPGRTRYDGDGSSRVVRFPTDEDTAAEKTKKDGGEGAWASVNYVFRKVFHVSPFMEMDHMYDWTFWQPRRDRIAVSTTMIKFPSDGNGVGSDQGQGKKFFNAYFDVRRRPFHPLGLCYQLVRLPVYCVVIQVWIHIEAFRIFLKGVEFVPHPEGAETSLSSFIGQMMAPFFAAKEWLGEKKSTSTREKGTKVE